jgi:uncharacterized protein with FMN-binding domain
MKKILLSSIFVVSFIAYAVYSAITGQPKPVPIADNNKTPENPNTKSTNNTPSTFQMGMMKTGMMKSYTYNDGSFIGNSADAYFGNIQIKVSIKNHLISDVQFLDYPKDRSTSLQISNNAMPILKSEAIQAQSANVDIVSGATQTSQAFIESLKSALVLAQQ